MKRKIWTKKDREYMEWWDSVARDYESKILSPLYPEVKNPIWAFIDQLSTKGHKKVLDLGCGTGRLLGSLSHRFEEVWGIDWSESMLQVAQSATITNKNVHLKKMDIRDLKVFYGYFDVIFSINTIASYRLMAAKQMLKETYKALKIGGVFVAVFPALEAILYQRELTHENYIDERLNTEEAWEKTDDYFIKRNKLDLEKGTYADDGIHIQKFFTEGEIYSLLQAVGLKDIFLERVLYPWILCKKYGYGYFPEKPEIWDWFCVAYK